MRFLIAGSLLLGAFGLLSGQPIDPEATPETVNLFYNLQNIAKGNLLFGHEDALAYGLNADGTRWIDEDDRSDVKSVTGSHPAVYGWEIGRLELDDSTANIDDVDFERMKYWIRTGYERGGIITISWHSNNPETGGDTWDTGGNAPGHVIPGGDKHDMYKGWLDRVADFAFDLKDAEGKFIPVLFRPYHEHMGSWFWWGRSSCTVDEYVTLWRFTVEYLRDVKGIHHFLYSYSPNNVSSQSQYLERYPGDDYVDILGTDDYSNVHNANQKSAFIDNLRIPVRLANEKGKVAALTETGNEQIPDDDWFTTRIVEPIKEDSIARQLAYFLVWRNGRPDHYYAPYPGHRAAEDLVSVYEDSFVQFEDELQDLYVTPEVSVLKQLPDLVFESGSEMLYEIDLRDHFAGADAYEVSFSSQNDLASVAINSGILTVAPTANKGEGTYRIKASSANQFMELMFLVEIEEVAPEEEKEVLGVGSEPAITVYPNPTSDMLRIQGGGDEIEMLKVFSGEGRLMYSLPFDELVDVRNLPSGPYSIAFVSKQKIIFRRFIKK